MIFTYSLKLSEVNPRNRLKDLVLDKYELRLKNIS